MQLYWYERLMVSGDFNTSYKKLLKKINAGERVSGIYLIMLSDRDDVILEIQPSYHISCDYYKREKGFVVGAAADNELAAELAARVAATVYMSGDIDNFKDFFRNGFLKRPDTDGFIYI